MNNNIQKLIRKNIVNLAPYSSAREEYTGNEGIFLDANENPFGHYNRYPDPYQKELKKRISELKKINPGQIFLGNGSDEIIDIAFRIFCEPGKDKALTFAPSYGMYEVLANINSIQLMKLPLNEQFQINQEELIPFLADEMLKIIFICSPNNPTGNLIKEKDILFILDHFKGIVYLDEAYIDFSNHPSCSEKIAQYPNLIVSQTLSKAWGLAGIRIGVAFMSEDVLSYFNKVKAPYNISTANQKIALEIINNETEYKRKINEILYEKNMLQKELQKLPMVKKIYPSDANFLLVEVDNAEELYKQLVEKKIIVRNRNSVIKNCVRITVGSKDENQKLIKAIKEIPNE